MDNNESINKIGLLPKILMYILLAFWTAVNIFPIYWMFTFSLKSNNELFGIGEPMNLIGLPRKWLWGNYAKAVQTGNLGGNFFNSILISAAAILIVLIASLMATYGMTRIEWRGSELMNRFFMLGLTIPLHASLIPVFLAMSKIGMTNMRMALIIPYAAFSLSMGILISAGFMEDIPKDLDEAAKIDGCGVWRTFITITVPLMKPAVSTVGIYTFLQCWNEFMFASVLYNSSKGKTLPVGVKDLFGQYTTDWGPIGAALVIATFPTLIIYVIFSKNIQESFIAGAVKG